MKKPPPVNVPPLEVECELLSVNEVISIRLLSSFASSTNSYSRLFKSLTNRTSSKAKLPVMFTSPLASVTSTSALNVPFNLLTYGITLPNAARLKPFAFRCAVIEFLSTLSALVNDRSIGISALRFNFCSMLPF